MAGQVEPPDSSPLGEVRYQALFDQLDEGVCVFERLPSRPDGLRDYRYLTMNPAMQAMFGIPDLSGESIRDHFPDESETWYDDYDQVLETGRPIRIERASEPQGVVLEMFVARVEDGTERRLMAVMKDITARARAEERLRESEQRYRAFVETTLDVIFRVSPDWSTLLCLEGRGFLADTFMPDDGWIDRYIDPHDQPRVLEVIERAIARKDVLEVEHRVIRADGTLGRAQSRAVPILDEDGRVLEWFGTAKDVTGRWEVDQALKASEAKYRSLFDSIDEGFCIIEVCFDEHGTAIDYVFRETNPAFERQTGLRDAVGKSVRSLLPGHESHWYETYGRIVHTGESERFENQAAQLGRWYDVYAWRFGDPGDRQVAVIFNDISARKQAEAELRDALAAKDQFLGFISHELRTPLTIIVSASHLLSTQAGDGQARELAADISTSAEELSDLIESLLLLVRAAADKEDEVGPPTHLGRVVQRSLEQQRARDSEHTYRLHADGIVPIVVGEETWLERVILNLIGNAAKYSPPDTLVDIRLEQQESEVRVLVLDEGVGIGGDEVERLFEPFYRGAARTGTAGAGLGLAVCKRIVESMGGRIWARPRHGGGSEFGIALPTIPMERDSDA